MEGRYYITVYEYDSLLFAIRDCRLWKYPSTPEDELQREGYVKDESFKPQPLDIPGLSYVSRWTYLDKKGGVAYVLMIDEESTPKVK
jgi:hypothetical protein